MTARKQLLAEMLDRFDQAEQNGHKGVRDFTRVKVSGSIYGYGVKCECGWEATPSTKRIRAASKAYWHVLDVLQIHPNSRVSYSEVVGHAL